MEELFDVFNRDGVYLGVKPKSFCHSKNPGVYHKPVWVWIINKKGEILLQKRAETKKWLPNKWDSSATGHVCAGETMLQGCRREVFEELGIPAMETDFKFWGEYIADSVWELGQIYLLESNLDISQMKMQTEEVLELKWFQFNDFKKLFYSDGFVPYDKQYKDFVMEKIKNYYSQNIESNEKEKM